MILHQVVLNDHEGKVCFKSPV